MSCTYTDNQIIDQWLECQPSSLTGSSRPALSEMGGSMSLRSSGERVGWCLQETEGPHTIRSRGICMSGNAAFDLTKVVTHLAKEGAQHSSVLESFRRVLAVLPVRKSAPLESLRCPWTG
jgi:hypothetical protein